MCGKTVPAGSVRIPSREADVSCPCFVNGGPDVQQTVRELENSLIPEVAGIREKNGWLLMDLSPQFYDSAVRSLAETEGRVVTETYCYQKMRMLTRYPGKGCPCNRDVQRALLLALVASEEPSGAHLEQAERALLTMAYPTEPEKRTELLSCCGDVARAAINLLYAE